MSACDAIDDVDARDIFDGDVPPDVLRFFEETNLPCEVREFMRETINEMRTEEARQAQFVSDVSHEIRTPLTAIRGAAETLLEGGVPEEMQQRFLSQIMSECDRLTRLANDLLTLQRAEGESMELTRINLRAVADNCALLMQGLVEERGVNLSVVGEAPDVMGNADALNQIFVNLIENASRFAGEGGHVRVEITCSEGHSVIAVKDDGPGFGDESPDHLFDRFYRCRSEPCPVQGQRQQRTGARHRQGAHRGDGWDGAGGEPSRSRGRSSSSPFPVFLPRTGRTSPPVRI